MSSARQRAERLLEKYFAPDDFTAEWMPGVIADLERALLDYARERVEEFRDRAAEECENGSGLRGADFDLARRSAARAIRDMKVDA